MTPPKSPVPEENEEKEDVEDDDDEIIDVVEVVSSSSSVEVVSPETEDAPELSQYVQERMASLGVKPGKKNHLFVPGQ